MTSVEKVEQNVFGLVTLHRSLFPLTLSIMFTIPLKCKFHTCTVENRFKIQAKSRKMFPLIIKTISVISCHCFVASDSQKEHRKDQKGSCQMEFIELTLR